MTGLVQKLVFEGSELEMGLRLGSSIRKSFLKSTF